MDYVRVPLPACRLCNLWYAWWSRVGGITGANYHAAADSRHFTLLLRSAGHIGLLWVAQCMFVSHLECDVCHAAHTNTAYCCCTAHTNKRSCGESGRLLCCLAVRSALPAAAVFVLPPHLYCLSSPPAVYSTSRNTPCNAPHHMGHHVS